MAIRLIIQGLRRSGTTIFWQSFRQDPRLLCYDEPFNQYIHTLPDRGILKHHEEFARLVEQDGPGFWEQFSPIHFTDELRERMSDRQREYLEYLGRTGEQVVLDTTRCHFKVAALHEDHPEAVLVHLFRDPASQVSSHLLPSHPGLKGKVRRYLHRRGFWNRDSNYDHWSFESIVGRPPHSLFAKRLREAGLDPDEVYRMPAVGRLLAYWKISYDRVESDGRSCFGERFVSQSFETFCGDPAPSLKRIYDRLGLDLPDLDLGRIHPPNTAYEPDSPEWRRYRDRLEIPDV